MMKVLSNNELKPEKPYGDQAALNVLSCVVIAFGKGCQEILDVQSQLLIFGVLPEHNIYGGRTEEGSQTG
ncbi:hypothetical protein [Acinetobacter seifertii]|uniref:hypothetical protein n=1 Tax=Acinetobacter seifertii TaxID=1530123 RepID=UPI00404187C5